MRIAKEYSKINVRFNFFFMFSRWICAAIDNDKWTVASTTIPTTGFFPFSFLSFFLG